MNKNSSIYRFIRNKYITIRWVNNTIRQYITRNSVWGKEYAQICYQYEKEMQFSRREDEKLRAFNSKEEYIRKLLRKSIPQTLAQDYSTFSIVDTNMNWQPIIWVYWWDGFENAPQIVQVCLTSILRENSNINIICLDKNNVFDYIQMPDDIIEKHEQGTIGRAHFSDIIRLSLLTQYGGLWMDATLLCVKSLPEQIWSADFYSCRQGLYDPIQPSHLRWAGWLLGGKPGFPLFSFSRDALIEYWRKYDQVVDYLLMDYVFDLAYETIPDVKSAVDSLEISNRQTDELMASINQPYNKSFFDNETYIYKLSYRFGKPKPETDTGEMTFYGYLLKEYLP